MNHKIKDKMVSRELLLPWIDRFMVSIPQLAKNTRQIYRNTFLSFVLYLEKTPDKEKFPQAIIKQTHFLDYLEKERGNSRQTRNNRLACLHSLFRYIADSDPLTFDHCRNILSIPLKRTNISTTDYLEREEIKAILGAVNHTTVDGYRDYTFLSFIYQTGARVQEVINLPARSLQLERPFQVRFLGKGRKERICPLWPDTVKMLRSLLKLRGIDPKSNALVFPNHRGGQLTRQGVRYLLAKYVRIATPNCSTLQRKRIHPHTMRHSCAMHLLESGVDINTIRAWLGHAHLNTTNRYAQISLEMKRKVLEKHVSIAKSKRPWKQNEQLLQWLESR